MAFQDLAGGNCAGVNPLRSLASHMNGDKSLQQEGLRPGQLEDLRRERFAAQEDAFAREFFQDDGGASSSAAAFRRHGPPGALAGMRLADMGGPQDWAAEFGRMSFKPEQHDFAEFEQIYRQGAMPPAWVSEFRADPQNMQPLTTEEFSMFEKYYHQRPAPKISEIPEEQWANEFAAKEKAADLETVWKEEEEQNAAIARALDEGPDPLTDMSDYEQFWPTDEDYGQAFFPKRIASEPYQFETSNPFLEHPNAFEEGMRLSNTGNLSDAALAMEAAVQKDPKHVEAWYQLGAIQAENEKEPAAISALQHAVELDPAHLNASLALSVSYTNESAERQAIEVLLNWARTKYPDIPFDSQEPLMPAHVIEHFLKIVRSSPSIDADVQNGLGVLFNVTSEYDKAYDCFKTALQVRPDDYLLLNRIGATLANGKRSEEAIQAYHSALQIKPSFVRARYNLGVSCINIGCYREAAEHFLSGLALHGRNDLQRNVSNNLWDTLWRTVVMMNRLDLQPLVTGRDLDGLLREFEISL